MCANHLCFSIVDERRFRDAAFRGQGSEVATCPDSETGESQSLLLHLSMSHSHSQFIPGGATGGTVIVDQKPFLYLTERCIVMVTACDCRGTL